MSVADMRATCSGGSSAKTQVHQVAKDISGHGNDLPLVRPPRRHDLTVDKVKQQVPSPRPCQEVNDFLEGRCALVHLCCAERLAPFGVAAFLIPHLSLNCVALLATLGFGL